VTPAGLNFNVEVVGTDDTGNAQTVVLTPTGNAPVNLKSVTASRNFTITQNQCNTPIQAQFPCTISVAFTPTASTPAGNVKGTLTVVDDAPGSPQIVTLDGTAVSTAQQLALSQTSVSFGSQAVGSASLTQNVYLIDLGPSSDTGPGSTVEIKSIQLGGKNASDFTESQTCGGSLGFILSGRTQCSIVVGFSPAAKSLGTRTATVTITPANEPVLTIQLIGSGVAAPAAKPPTRAPVTSGRGEH
jgi:Abnormal spindle-like microcephaly-assoc'd, ASPM-SPD-2-Hydin